MTWKNQNLSVQEILYLDKKFTFKSYFNFPNYLDIFKTLGWSIKNSNIDSSLIILFTVGFCGGFTTFSSFSYESLTLINNNQLLNLFIYIFSSILIGIFAVFVGLKISKYL